MKIRMIYKETESLEDLSKDRVHLNLSWNEWSKIKNFIHLVKYELPENSRLLKKAQNLENCIENAQELPSIWDEGR